MTNYNNIMRETFEPRYSRETLPGDLRMFSPGQVNTLLHLGWTEAETLVLLDYAQSTGSEPDWSEADWDELLDHFVALFVEYILEKAGR